MSRARDFSHAPESPISHWDEFFSTCSEARKLLDAATTQLPLAQKRLQYCYETTISRGVECPRHGDEEEFRAELRWVQHLAILIQSLKADVAVLENEVAKAARQGKRPDDRVVGVPGVETQMSWMEFMVAMNANAGEIGLRLERNYRHDHRKLERCSSVERLGSSFE